MIERGPRNACLLAAVMAPAMANAADWSMQSAAQLHAVAESNPQLSAGEKQGAQAGVADASLDLSRRTELLDLGLTAHASTYRYTSDVGLDRDDQQLALALARRGETWMVQGNASYTRDTTLTSELGTTGNTGFNRRHRARALSLAPLWQLTERLSAGVNVGWQDSSYARGPQNGLSDYDYMHAGFNVGFEVSETTSASLVLNAGRLDSALYAFNTDNLDLRLQLEHSWSPRWKGSIAVGPSRVQADAAAAHGSLFSASLTRQSERFALGLSLARNNAPNGTGLLSRRDELGLNANLALSGHLNATAGVSVIRSRDLASQAGFTGSDVRYGRADLSLSWAFARDWSLALGAGGSGQQISSSSARGWNVDGRMMLAWRHHNPVG